MDEYWTEGNYECKWQGTRYHPKAKGISLFYCTSSNWKAFITAKIRILMSMSHFISIQRSENEQSVQFSVGIVLVCFKGNVRSELTVCTDSVFRKSGKIDKLIDQNDRSQCHYNRQTYYTQNSLTSTKPKASTVWSSSAVEFFTIVEFQTWELLSDVSKLSNCPAYISLFLWCYW